MRRKPGASRLSGLASALLLVIVASCNGGDGLRTFASTDVGPDELPAADAGRVWRYRMATVNADSLVRVLERSSLPLAEVWVPLIDVCEDPVGPRLTVVLSRPDDGVARYDFEPGNGIRACTLRVRRYRWIR